MILGEETTLKLENPKITTFVRYKLLIANQPSIWDKFEKSKGIIEASQRQQGSKTTVHELVGDCCRSYTN